MRLLDGESSGLLCVPLPWEEGDNIGAAVMIYESRALAQAGLDHYLALTGAASSPCSPYHLLPLGVRELVGVLETRPEVGFEPKFRLYEFSDIRSGGGNGRRALAKRQSPKKAVCPSSRRTRSGSRRTRRQASQLKRRWNAMWLESQNRYNVRECDQSAGSYASRAHKEGRTRENQEHNSDTSDDGGKKSA